MTLRFSYDFGHVTAMTTTDIGLYFGFGCWLQSALYGFWLGGVAMRLLDIRSEHNLNESNHKNGVNMFISCN